MGANDVSLTSGHISFDSGDHLITTGNITLNATATDADKTDSSSASSAKIELLAGSLLQGADINISASVDVGSSPAGTESWASVSSVGSAIVDLAGTVNATST